MTIISQTVCLSAGFVCFLCEAWHLCWLVWMPEWAFLHELLCQLWSDTSQWVSIMSVYTEHRDWDSGCLKSKHYTHPLTTVKFTVTLVAFCYFQQMLNSVGYIYTSYSCYPAPYNVPSLSYYNIVLNLFIGSAQKYPYCQGEKSSGTSIGTHQFPW